MRARMAPAAPAPIMMESAAYAADSSMAKQWAAGGAGASTQAQEGLTQVRFTLPQTLSVPTGQTVSVPFIDTSLQAESLSVYRSGQAGDHPTAAIWVNNEQANSLPPGIITVFNEQDGHVGDAELAGLPDNVAGMAQGIVRLRNQYAPNVLLDLDTWVLCPM